MAPRILHFGKDQLTWECVGKRCSERSGHAGGVGPDPVPTIPDTRLSSMPFVWPQETGLEEGGRQAERLVAFYHCIRDFTGRKLTKRPDKLPALSGLASAFQTPELGAYLAGLWEKDLAHGLNWRPRIPEPNEDLDDVEEYIAPSWSWASMPVRCEVQDVELLITDRPDWEKDFEQFNSTLAPRLLSFNIELATSDPYGRISAASITLRGHTRPLLLWPCEQRRESPFVPYGACLDRPTGYKYYCGNVWMFGPPYEYLPWADFEEWNPLGVCDKHKTRHKQFIALPVALTYTTWLSMLVLDPVEGLEDTYRRVGHVEVYAPSEMDPARWEEKDLTLI